MTVGRWIGTALSIGSETGVPKGRRIAVPGHGEIFVRTLDGPPDAPTLVLVHGLAGSSVDHWSAVMKPLSRFFNVIAPDLRGHGKGAHGVPFSLEACADDIAALCDTLGVQQAVFAGFSMGGAVIQLINRFHRNLVQGLVFAGSAAEFPRSPLLCARGNPLARVVAGYLNPLGRNDRTAVREAADAVVAYNANGGEWPALRRVKVPASVVVLTKDLVIAPSHQRRLAEEIPASTVFECGSLLGHFGYGTPAFSSAFVDACRHVAETCKGLQACEAVQA